MEVVGGHHDSVDLSSALSVSSLLIGCRRTVLANDEPWASLMVDGLVDDVVRKKSQRSYFFS